MIPVSPSERQCLFSFLFFLSLVFFAAPRRPTRQKSGEQLCGDKCVQQTKASAGAFAAILDDNSVVGGSGSRPGGAGSCPGGWGSRPGGSGSHPGGRSCFGGDSSQVGEQLAAVLEDGSVVTSVFSRSKQVQALPGRRLCGGWFANERAHARVVGAHARVVRAHARVERAPI